MSLSAVIRKNISIISLVGLGLSIPAASAFAVGEDIKKVEDKEKLTSSKEKNKDVGVRSPGNAVEGHQKQESAQRGGKKQEKLGV